MISFEIVKSASSHILHIIIKIDNECTSRAHVKTLSCHMSAPCDHNSTQDFSADPIGTMSQPQQVEVFKFKKYQIPISTQSMLQAYEDT